MKSVVKYILSTKAVQTTYENTFNPIAACIELECLSASKNHIFKRDKNGVF